MAHPLLGADVPLNVSRAFPEWVFTNGTSSSAQQQSHPDAVFVRSIPGPPAHLDPTNIPPQDRDNHLVELKFCPDINPFATLDAATTQQARTITRLKTRSSRNPYRNNKEPYHTLRIICMHFTFMGLPGGGAGRVAVESRRRRVRASRSMADNPPDPD
eukprot:1153728-Pelagomonas_calceolata.AAC.6